MSGKVQWWTPERLTRLVERVREQVSQTGRVDWPILADELGTTVHGCRFAYERNAVMGKMKATPIAQLMRDYQQNTVEETVRRIANEEPARDGVIRPYLATLNLDIPPPRLAERTNSGVTKALLYGDVHFPHHDTGVLEIVGQIAATLQPDVLVNVGDLLDCYSLSRFDKDPHRIDNLQDEIDLARIHLAQMRSLVPDARFLLLEGNHEDRLRRVIWGMSGEVASLNKLTCFRQAMTWPSLLGLDDLHIEFVEAKKQSKGDFLPKFILKHGEKVRQYSSYTARGEMETYNYSGASGHTHRFGEYFRRDRNGAHVWIETGCCCSLTPEYVADPNWQNGCVVLTFDNATGAVATEIVHVLNGLAMWRGSVYRATKGGM